MFCTNCGQLTEEGKGFCTACGAPLTEVSAATDSLSPTPTPPPPAPSVTPPPPLAQSSTSSPVPPPPPGGPTYGYAGSPPGWPPPGGGAPRRGRGSLIAGIVVAIIVVLAGAGVGIYFGVIRDGDDVASNGGAATSSSIAQNTSASNGVSTSSTATTTTSLADGATATTMAQNTTLQTIPSLNTTTSKTTSTTGRDLLTEYLTLTDTIVAELEYDDARIPELATDINNTAPNVPARVRNELQDMLDTLDRDWVDFSLMDVPTGFEDSAGALDTATYHMYNRIQATIDGIDVMKDTGKVASANSYFDEGRLERDAYRAAMQEYRGLVPIE